MTLGPLIGKCYERVSFDRQDSDIAYFHSLSLFLEYITKIVTAGVVACLGEDAERHKYNLEHKLVRSNSIGEWVEVMNAALTGPAAQFFLPEATNITRDLTQRVSSNDWRFQAVRNLVDVAKIFQINGQMSERIALRRLFEIHSTIRNRTRGHGAPTCKECNEACPFLSEALDQLINNLIIFQKPWAYLHRNLSGKYRVSPLLGDCSSFEYLKKTRETSLPKNGVYLYLNYPILVPLVFSDPDLKDVFIPNGNYKSNTFEALSYASNDLVRKDGTAWKTPPGTLPRSETEGQITLEPVGNTFSNLPQIPRGYIRRKDLEFKIVKELTTIDRHPIITLTGPGGIGKTTVALAAIHEITGMVCPSYELVLWMSARDVDLLESGPKPVTPKVVRKGDIVDAAINLLEPSNRNEKGFNSVEYFQKCLTQGAAGSTLFVFDNFETLENPADIFSWIDTYVRLPNKVLITTRFRDFVGDYPIEVCGMIEEEAFNLIDQEARRLGISTLLSAEYKEELIQESDGHPYVIKILLGQVAQEKRAVKPQRIVANAEFLLAALFERTYESLTPGAQMVFLLLSSWRVYVPAIAVEAVFLTPDKERFDVSSAIEELRRFSLIDEVRSQIDEEIFVGVPLAAASFGRQKLEFSPQKVAVDESRKLLMEFGAGKREDVRLGVLPRLNRIIDYTARVASENPTELEKLLPVLEYLASRVPRSYLRLVDVILENDEALESKKKAKEYLRRYLERAEESEKATALLKLAEICHSTEDAVGEVHALSEIALLPTTNPEEYGMIANRINNRIRDLKGRRVEEAWSEEVRLLIEKVARIMERRLKDLSADDCSRLAWLYLNIRNEDKARDVTREGIKKDPNNEHCLKLAEKLNRAS